jgi:hypothetical protein
LQVGFQLPWIESMHPAQISPLARIFSLAGFDTILDGCVDAGPGISGCGISRGIIRVHGTALALLLFKRGGGP